VILRKN
jgi:dephospho-CoA kinase